MSVAHIFPNTDVRQFSLPQVFSQTFLVKGIQQSQRGFSLTELSFYKTCWVNESLLFCYILRPSGVWIISKECYIDFHVPKGPERVKRCVSRSVGKECERPPEVVNTHSPPWGGTRSAQLAGKQCEHQPGGGGAARMGCHWNEPNMMFRGSSGHQKEKQLFCHLHWQIHKTLVLKWDLVPLWTQNRNLSNESSGKALSYLVNPHCAWYSA